MSEGDNSKRPSQKMIDFATSIAKRLGVDLPDNAADDFSICTGFIDANKAAVDAIPFPPTEKQLSFAKSIAEKKGVAIPPATLAHGKELSKWIDANKA